MGMIVDAIGLAFEKRVSLKSQQRLEERNSVTMEFKFKFQKHEIRRGETGAADFNVDCRRLHDNQSPLTRIDADTTCTFFRAVAPRERMPGFIDRVFSACICHQWPQCGT